MTIRSDRGLMPGPHNLTKTNKIYFKIDVS